MAWARRADFVFDVEPFAQSIAKAKDLDGKPVILVDHGDNCGAGGTTDMIEVLEACIDQQLEDLELVDGT